MVANTAMDTDKIKIYGARVKVDSLSKVAAIEQACSQCMNQSVAARLRHGSMMTSTPSTRRRLDGVPLGVFRRSIRSARSRFRRGRT